MNYLDYIKNIEPANKIMAEYVKDRFDKKNKPLGSLGNLEQLMIQISSIKNSDNFSLENRKHFVFASDNGVVEEGVSPCKKELSLYVSETMLEGKGAIAIMCETYGVDFSLVDVGLDGNFSKSYENLVQIKTTMGTKNIKNEAAMSQEELHIIFQRVFDLVEKSRMDICSCGEMGIGNTTTSASIIYKILGGDLGQIVGCGSGADSEMLIKKKEVITEACKRVVSKNPFEILRQLGGFDIVAMTAFYLACAYYKIPVILDGFISMAAALVAYEINPHSRDYMIASHKTKEEGVSMVYSHMEMSPMLHMNMALGEGTGALLVYPIVKCISPLYQKMMDKEEFEKKYKI